MSNQTTLANISDTERKLMERVDAGVAQGIPLSTGAGGVQFANALQVMEFAKMMSVSAIAVPKHLRGNPGACLAVTIQAVEWKMSPYAVANKSYSVNDRLAYESQLVQAVILQRAPIKGRFRFTYSGEGLKRRVHVAVTTSDGEIVEYESPELGKIPVQNSPLWKGDPDQQLSYYAGRALCRRHFPDVLLGVYTADEAEMMPRGPEAARDITPAKSGPLSDRMAAIAKPAVAGVGDHDPEPVDTDEVDHDPETGEIATGETSSASSIDVAEDRGREAKRDGLSRRAMPGEYRDSTELATAWLHGWDAEPVPAGGIDGDAR